VSKSSQRPAPAASDGRRSPADSDTHGDALTGWLLVGGGAAGTHAPLR
jgi:hypothetical protein